MIGISDRGWGWTKAILSLKAKRIHLCGDERALSIITRLVEMTGDVLEERRYSRLSKLILVHKNFRLESISEGDCVINFSVSSLI
jgi:ATP-dependent RNA helicase SUPV3L1/SUV3